MNDLEKQATDLATEIAKELLNRNAGGIKNWFVRRRLQFLPINFNVMLSINSEHGLNTGIYFNEIKKHLNRLLDESSLSTFIKIKDYSQAKKFENKKEVETFRKSKDIDLIIWGDFSHDSLKQGGKPLSVLNLNFTYGHPETREKRIGKMINLDLSSKFAKKNYWQIVDENSYQDIKVVSNNLFDMCVYILALTLKLYGQIEKSLVLFEILFSSLEERKDNFKDLLIPHLSNLYSIKIVDAIWYKKKRSQGLEVCKKMLSLQPNNFFALSNLSLFEYLAGDMASASENVKLLKRLYPNKAVTHFDVAFFKILNKDYKGAYEEYRKLMNPDYAGQFNPQQVVEFLYIEYTKNKEPAFLYACGFISYYFGDRTISKQDLTKFIRLSDRIIYKYMTAKAERLLKTL